MTLTLLLDWAAKLPSIFPYALTLLTLLLLLASFSLKDYGIVYWGFDEEQHFE